MDTYKNRDIEILRAVAISFVLFFHWAPHALARLGGFEEQFPNYTSLWSGVDLFFCISGFVITSSLLREIDRAPQGGRFASFAIPFWIRRMWRLWPSAWLWIFVSVMLAYWFNTTGLFGLPRNTAKDAVMAVSNLYNIHKFFCDHDQSCGSLSIYWSLSLEEQFYFVFPFLFFFLRRRALGIVLIAVALAQCFVPRPIVFAPNMPSLLWLIRTDAICFGAIIALWRSSPSYGRMKPLILVRKPLRILITVPLLCVLAVAAAPRLALSQATGVLAVVSAILVWIASYGADFIFPKVPSFEPVLSWLGSRSYSLYLIHATGGRIAAELRARLPDSANGAIGIVSGMLMTIVLTFALSELNYRFVELPLRRRGREIARKEHGDVVTAQKSLGVIAKDGTR